MIHPPQLVLGIDTHKDVHVAVLLDRLGRYLAGASLAPPTRPTPSWWPGPIATARSRPPASRNRQLRLPARPAPDRPEHRCGRGEPPRPRPAAPQGQDRPGRRRGSRPRCAGWRHPCRSQGPQRRRRGAARAGGGSPQRDQGPHPGHQPAPRAAGRRRRRAPQPAAPATQGPPGSRLRPACPPRRACSWRWAAWATAGWLWTRRSPTWTQPLPGWSGTRRPGCWSATASACRPPLSC